MEEAVHSPRLVRFGTFEVDLQAGELRKGGLKLKLTGQPFQVLAILLERHGEVVTREELQKRLWPDTFVDVDHNLNTAINKIREALRDPAESPRFVETLPRRGYRFIAPVEGAKTAVVLGEEAGSSARRQSRMPRWAVRTSVLFAAIVLLAGAGFFIYKRQSVPTPPVQRSLTRLTFDDGLQVGATWSPDGRFIAYSSDRGGKFDIWIQQVSGGDPVQVTKGPGHNRQPDWSPDGKYIAYRSEEGEGGLYIVPALGGAGLQRKLASFGYYPRWSLSGSQILFQSIEDAVVDINRFYVVSVDGSAPREVSTGLLTNQNTGGVSAVWHPDGRRISVWVQDIGNAPSPVAPSFWTVPVEGGVAVQSKIPDELLKQFKEVAGGPGIAEWRLDFRFSWAPSGKAVYFERTFQGAKNIWRMAVDPQTLRALAFERLTTGSGPDTDPSLSPDGKELAYTGERQIVRAWMFPFDAKRGLVTGPGKPVSAPGVEAWEPSLSRDGKTLAYRGNRAGRWELWETSISDGRQAPIAADDSYLREVPQWSPDGTHLAYFRVNPSTRESQIIDWSSLTREERTLTPPNNLWPVPYDWSADGKWLLISQTNAGTSRNEVWAVPTAVGMHAEAAARKILSDPAYDFFQGHFSSDGRWIVFEATSGSESKIYAISAAGGPWIPITGGKHWDDKPRWSPDGKKIYFVSGRSGFYNVWGIRFDPVKGSAVGDPFSVTTFNSPSLMIPKYISAVEISLTQNRLIVNVAQVSGSIWVLDNVDR